MLAAGTATVSLTGAGAGVGIVFGGLLLAVSRNPTVKRELFQFAILGFALTEAVGLLGLMMAFLLLFR
jgi:F-type H+-transporting ATPase subunit c